MPPRTPAIGLLADLITLADLQVTRDDLSEQLDAWIASQHRTPTGANAHYGAELEEAYADADFELQAVMGGLLERGVFTRILQAGVAQGHLSADRADRLTEEAIELASQGVSSGPDGGVELERLLLALPVCGEGAEIAYAADPVAFLQGLTVALGELVDEPALQLVLFPVPVHPLAWAELTVDERFGVFTDLQIGIPAAATQRLLDAHAQVLDRAAYPEDDARWAQVASPLRMWPVLASAPLDPLRENSLEQALLMPQDSRAWGTWVRALGLESPPADRPPQEHPGQSWMSAPLPVQDILPVTAVDQVHHLQTTVTTPLRLVEVTAPDMDADGVAWRTLAFEDADGWPFPYALQDAWLGSVPAQRELAIARAFERWNGTGPGGLEAITVPEPVPEPPRPPRQRPTLRVVR